jgi:hypothetical protein
VAPKTGPARLAFVFGKESRIRDGALVALAQSNLRNVTRPLR